MNNYTVIQVLSLSITVWVQLRINQLFKINVWIIKENCRPLSRFDRVRKFEWSKQLELILVNLLINHHPINSDYQTYKKMLHNIWEFLNIIFDLYRRK